jgi:hypothetical protein
MPHRRWLTWQRMRQQDESMNARWSLTSPEFGLDEK